MYILKYTESLKLYINSIFYYIIHAMLIYKILSTILFLTLLPFYSVVRACKGKYIPREKFGIYKKLNGKVIMFHGVSVGEVIALENLIKKTKEAFPDYKIVITTGTRTGQDTAHKKFDGIADYITYFPFDITFSVKSFLNAVNPSVVLMAETEIWPTFATYCKKRNIKLFLINGRISDSTYKYYRMLKVFFRELFKNYTGVYTQSMEDNKKFLAIGSPADRTEIMKNLKFDVKMTDTRLNFGKGRIIIAGSTHKGEDEIILNSFTKVKKSCNDIKLLLAPRHLTRLSSIIELVRKTNLTYGLRSQNASFDDKDIIILDTFGELTQTYQLCEFAFIGGSFNKTGGHNPLEAVVYGKPVITGPSIHNFKDIYGILSNAKAGKIVKTPLELTNYMEKLLSDRNFYNTCRENCKNIFEEQQGALEFVIKKLKSALS